MARVRLWPLYSRSKRTRYILNRDFLGSRAVLDTEEKMQISFICPFLKAHNNLKA
jgi:hypothetical protein